MTSGPEKCKKAHPVIGSFEEEQMYRQRRSVVKQALGLGLLVALIVSALSACGQENKSPDSSEPRATNLHGKILFARKGG